MGERERERTEIQSYASWKKTAAMREKKVEGTVLAAIGGKKGEEKKAEQMTKPNPSFICFLALGGKKKKNPDQVSN